MFVYIPNGIGVGAFRFNLDHRSSENTGLLRSINGKPPIGSDRLPNGNEATELTRITQRHACGRGRSAVRFRLPGFHSSGRHQPFNKLTMHLEDSTLVCGPPMRLVMQWIDEMWAEESASVGFDRREITSVRVEEEEEPAFDMSQDFQLLEPLRTRQRKSYDGESRFLSPRPVVVINSNSPLINCIKRCTVSVRLLDEDGSPLELLEQSHLFGPNGKDALLSLPHRRTPPISVKLSGKIGLRALRLGFTIDYETEEGDIGQSHLTSNVFHLARERCPGKKKTLSHETYYNTFDEKRDSVAVWNGTPISGVQSIAEAYMILPRSKHRVDSVDCHPISLPGDTSQRKMLLNVSGRVSYAGKGEKIFQQTFVISQEESTQHFFIASDTFRLVG
ncbi:Protein NXT-1, isoform a [Planoprotostelium fungivorum]|uniref:Protein NXT-1, isoform a n=1 Tax=Planoprotostelium fungivorum TaxID=1890364 RepID=A0A2P6N202_9EUKA|nr:Protein NXT-1, isoform a [Planoprotostelium fungivorum]